MLSLTAQYALRAMVFIAGSDPERPVLAREIAEHTGVPLQYLSRILRDAVREGLLTSTRGIGGGFRLARASNRMRLIEVLAPFDDVVGRSRCPFGQPRCSDDHPCGFHVHWKPVAAEYRRMLEQTTLADVEADGFSISGSRPRR